MTTTTMITVERAYRFCLDTNPTNAAALERNAGAARWGFNHAHHLMLQQFNAYQDRKTAAAHTITGMDAETMATTMDKTARIKTYTQARKQIAAENKALCADLTTWDDHRKRVTHKGKPTLDPGDTPGPDATPLQHKLHQRRLELAALQQADPTTYTAERKAELAQVRPNVLEMKRSLAEQGAYMLGAYDIQNLWRTTRDLPKDQGGSPWWGEVTPGALLCGIDRATNAWKNWMDSATGKRAGRRIGLPRFKKRGKARDSFTLTNPGRAVIHFDDYRHLRLAGTGTFRLHQTAKPLLRLIRKGMADVTSVTISRHGHRWYASVLAKVTQPAPHKPTRRQAANGLIAADLGSQPLAWLSHPLDMADPTTKVIEAAKPYHAEHHRIAKAQRVLSRTQRGSKNRTKAAKALGRIHALVATRRATNLHLTSKRLATQAAYIAIEDLDITALTKSAKGTVDQPGTDVALRATYNRHLLDAGLGELRRQLAYKTRWYGSSLIALDKAHPTATLCSKCGERNPSSKPSDTRYTCPHCGLDVPRRENAARNIYKQARATLTDTSVACGKRDT